MEFNKNTNPQPNVTYGLIALMFLIHLFLSTLPIDDALNIYATYSLIPDRFFDGILVDTLITYIFLHGSWMHLIINCITLLGAGVIVERDLGSQKFLGSFLLSGVIAGLFHSLVKFSSNVPIIGASGAIFGVIATLFLLTPFKITYALIIPMPSVIVGLLLSAFELYSLRAPSDLMIAHDAHIAGFAFGCIYAFFVDKKRAFKGLIIALLVSGVVYYIGITYGFI